MENRRLLLIWFTKYIFLRCSLKLLLLDTLRFFCFGSEWYLATTLSSEMGLLVARNSLRTRWEDFSEIKVYLWLTVGFIAAIASICASVFLPTCTSRCFIPQLEISRGSQCHSYKTGVILVWITHPLIKWSLAFSLCLTCFLSDQLSDQRDMITMMPSCEVCHAGVWWFFLSKLHIEYHSTIIFSSALVSLFPFRLYNSAWHIYCFTITCFSAQFWNIKNASKSFILISDWWRRLLRIFRFSFKRVGAEGIKSRVMRKRMWMEACLLSLCFYNELNM